MIGKAITGITPVKAALLSIGTLVAIAMFGVGIYSADASAGHTVVIDGYGVSAPAH
jgi:hypothetical protein